MDEFRNPRHRIWRGALSRWVASTALACALLLLPGQALGASVVWDGGCGEDPSWSCAANWGKDVVPGPGDTVAFNRKSTGTAVVDPGFGGEVATLRLTAGFPGRVALDRTLTLSKGFQQSDGEFAAGESALTAKAFMLNGGAFQASSGTTSVSGTLKISGAPEFDANGGTLVVAGTGGTLTCNGVTLDRVVFANDAGAKTVAPSCDLPLGADPTAGAGGSIKLRGTLSGSGALSSTGTLVLEGTGALAGFSALSADGLTVNGVYDFGAYSGLSVAGAFLLNGSGSFTAPAATASFGGAFKIAAAAGFDANGGTVVFDGTGNSALACANKSFSLVRFEQTEGTRTVEKTCSLPLGGAPTLGAGSGASVRLNGTLSGTGTLAVDHDLTMNRTAQLSGFGGLEVLGDLSVVSATANFSAYAPFSVDGAYGQAGGKVTAPGGADFGGSFALNPRAVFEAPPGAISVGGDFSVYPEATFNANGGTVVLDGSGQAVTGSTAFYNLTKVVSAADALTFGSGDTQTIQGLLKLEGKNAGNLLRLAPTTPGSPWRIDKEGTAEVAFVSVADSVNVGAPIVATESKSEGGNPGWSVSAAAAQLVLQAQTTTPAAGAADTLTVVAKDAYGNTAASYTGLRNLTFGPVADSPSGAHASVTNFAGGGIKFGAPTQIAFVAGVAVVAGGSNGAMTLVKAGPASITVTDGSISNGAGLSVAVSPGAAERLAWSNPTSTGALGSPCLFTCTGKELGKSGYFKANVSVTDDLGNRVSNLGSGHKVSVSADHGSIGGASLTIASTGPAESTTQFTYAPSTGGAVTVTAETSAGTAYAAATASMMR
jgi:hypothetical protein